MNSSNNQPDEQPILLTEKEVGQLIGFAPRTLQNWRSRGGGPPFVRVSKGCVRYRRQDIDAWAEERLRVSTADDAARGTVLRKSARTRAAERGSD